MAGACQHVQLLLAGQVDELDSVAGNADGEVGVFFLLGVLHGVQQLLLAKDVHVQVVCALIKVQEGGWFHSIFKITVGTGRSASRYPIGFLWMIILVLVMEYVLNHTKFGRYTIAIGSNKEAAALSGINVKFYHVMVYVVCGLFTGLAAIAYAAVTPTVQPGTGAGLEMDAIGGVFVGGVAATGGYGSVIGTLAGIFVIMLLKTGLPYIGLQANWQQIITGAVLIIAVLIDIMKEKKAAAK